MKTTYHRSLTVQALGGFFSPEALEMVIAGNLHQDRPAGQIGHDEYHFDQNAFEVGRAYMEANRVAVLPALQAGELRSARRAFGRLTHAAQDFYAHSNYVSLWLEGFPAGQAPAANGIEPLDARLLNSPRLRSGKVYWPLEPLSWLPGIGRFLVPLLPRDSHAWMNLDGPERGPLFAYAFAAALQRTRTEYEQTVANLPPDLLVLFLGQPIPAGEV